MVAVSPIIGGQAVKGPTAKMMRELGLSVTATTVGERYADFLDGYVVDDRDASGLDRPEHRDPCDQDADANTGRPQTTGSYGLDLADELSAS